MTNEKFQDAIDLLYQCRDTLAVVPGCQAMYETVWKWCQANSDAAAEVTQTITQLHAAVKTAQELAATRLMEIERLREVLTIPNITPDTTSSALFIRTLSEHEKGQPVNAQDLINALMWRVKNQRKEIARLHATIGGES